MVKHEAVARLVRRRIFRGDYALAGVPSERRLAEELGICRMTARKALALVEGEGYLVRLPNGRLHVDDEAKRRIGLRQVAFLAPAFASPFLRQVLLAAERMAGECGAHVRSVEYVHADDPVVVDVLESFDAVFLCGIADDAAEHVSKHLARTGTPVVAVESDLTAWGIPSMLLFPPSDVLVLLDHLAALGHETIDCINTLPMSPGVERRLEQWRLWCDARRIGGALHNRPVVEYGSPAAEAHAYVSELLRGGAVRASGLLVTSELSAIGVLRAIAEAGLTAGRDLSVCTFGGDGLYRYMNPSLTALEMPPLEPYLRPCFEYFEGRDGWNRPLLLKPDAPVLFRGESTGPANRFRGGGQSEIAQDVSVGVADSG